MLIQCDVFGQDDVVFQLAVCVRVDISNTQDTMCRMVAGVCIVKLLKSV